MRNKAANGAKAMIGASHHRPIGMSSAAEHRPAITAHTPAAYAPR